MQTAYKVLIAGLIVLAVVFIFAYWYIFIYQEGGDGIQCKDDDGVCPPGCNSLNDNDCPVGYVDAEVVTLYGPSDVSPGQEVDLSMIIKNIGDTRTKFLVEMGIIPVPVAENWGFLSLFTLATMETGQCCPGQENLFDTWITLDPMESETVEVRIKAPHMLIEDKCFDNDYWDGVLKNYVIYASIHDECWDPTTGHLTYDFETKYVWMNLI